MDELIADGETAEGIDAQGDLAAGGAGNDFVYGTDHGDALFGDDGHDLLVGGGGDDVIVGDINVSDADWNWSVLVKDREKVERLELADGHYLTDADVNRVIQEICAFAADEGIHLKSVEDARRNEELMTLVAGSWQAVG